MSSEVLVRVENVSKRFCRSLKRSLLYGLQDLGSEMSGRRHGGGGGLPKSSADVELRKDEFWAVKDVSFELRRGECLGLIGSNGAGKTTLLRMLNGLIKPDAGRIKTSGTVGALIALGAGFNPVLTGRENIYTSAAVYGLSTIDIKKRIDDIIEFSELNDFIDSPLQSYSSGMQVRLGFAVATSLDPDILILDEVLAVGDLNFRKKCYQRLGEIKSRAATIIVTHDQSQLIQVADYGLYLHSDRNQVKAKERVATSIADYNNDAKKRLSEKQAAVITRLKPNSCQSIVVNPSSISVHQGENISIRIDVGAETSTTLRVLPRAFVRDASDTIVAEWMNEHPIDLKKGINILKLEWEDCLLQPGAYSLDFNLYELDGLSSFATVIIRDLIAVKGVKHGSSSIHIGEVSINNNIECQSDDPLYH